MAAPGVGAARLGIDVEAAVRQQAVEHMAQHVDVGRMAAADGHVHRMGTGLAQQGSGQRQQRGRILRGRLMRRVEIDNQAHGHFWCGA
jgi:hypothetical protein